MTDTAPSVHRTHHRGITTLTLDSPANRNALSATLVRDLSDALTRCGEDDDVRAVVLTHTGNTFCAGADLRDPPDPKAMVALLRHILDLPRPVVARVTGQVRAGGLGLLGACDIAAGGPDAGFALPEVRIGVAPAVISLTLRPPTDPRALARYSLTGERFGSAEAARIGVLTMAGADVDDLLEPVLDGLRRASPRALTETKRLLTAKVLENFERDASELTSLSSRLFASADAREGVTAFLEGRDPGWVL